MKILIASPLGTSLHTKLIHCHVLPCLLPLLFIMSLPDYPQKPHDLQVYELCNVQDETEAQDCCLIYHRHSKRPEYLFEATKCSRLNRGPLIKDSTKLNTFQQKKARGRGGAHTNEGMQIVAIW